MQDAILRPERCMAFLRPGRLITVHAGEQDWGTGIIVAVSRHPGGKPAGGTANGSSAGNYMVDVLLECAPGCAPGEAACC